MFDEWALGYLTQLPFRVLYRKGEDETRPSSYTVQVKHAKSVISVK